MRRTPVYSSNLAEVGYEETSRILEVLFLSGGLYHYFDVPPRVHTELMDARSHSGYLNSRIKGKYKHRIVK